MSHPNARLNVHGRVLLCERVFLDGWEVADAARACGVSRQTAHKWIRRFVEGGLSDLHDRPSRPVRIRPRVPARVIRRIWRRRRLREGPHRISWETGIPRSTVYKVLRRVGHGRLAALDRPVRETPLRYEHANPGDLIHFDTKRLGRIGPGGGKRVHGWTHAHEHRGIGHEVVHVAIDDHSRIAYAEVLDDERGETTAGFAARAFGHFEELGITPRRVLSDNAFCYTSRAFLETLAGHDVSPRRIRPYRPQTNGKAEAMVRTLVNGWAYARPYDSSNQRTAELERFLTRYNRFRPHGGIGGLPPISRAPGVNNVCGKFS